MTRDWDKTRSRQEHERGLAFTLMQAPVLRYELPAGFTPDMMQAGLYRDVVAAVLSLAEGGGYDDARPDRAALADATGREAAEIAALEQMQLRPVQVKRTAQAIRETHLASRLADDLLGKAHLLRQGSDRASVVRELVRRLELEGADAATPDSKTFLEIAQRAAERMAEVKQRGRKDAAWLSTGYPNLDAMGAWMWGSYVLMAARPGKGKTTLAMNIAARVAGRGVPVLVHSLEMADVEQFAKVASDFSVRSSYSGGLEGVSVQQILTEAEFGERDWALYESAHDRAARLPIHLNDEHMGLSDVLRISRRHIRRDGVKLVVVDYAQLVEAEGKRGQARYEAVGEVSKALRRLALHGCGDGPVVVLAAAQLRRARPGDEGKQPQLSDLRESGNLEQDATHVWLLHDMDDLPDPGKYAGLVKVIAAKQRFAAGSGAQFRLLQKQLEFSRFVPRDFTREEAA